MQESGFVDFLVNNGSISINESGAVDCQSNHFLSLLGTGKQETEEQ